MWTIISALIIGLLLGMINKSVRLKSISNSLLDYLVYLLIGLMGISLGQDEEIVSNLAELGLNAFIFAAAGVTGSIFLVLLVFYLIEGRDKC
jgi:uncharacterized membrane protein YbjE (DUF340 family)